MYRRKSSICAGAVLITLVAFSALCAPAAADDWPTYRRDSQRSGWSYEKLQLPLEVKWVYRSATPPTPAWGGPARADFYTPSQTPLKPRLAFDRCYHVAVVGRYVYFGCSADDSVYCLDRLSGRVKWSFCTDSPVRMAPYVEGGKVFVGSDDGSVYCLSASDGSVIWKYTAAGKSNYFIPNNGRFVSPWAVRSGIAVSEGTVYFSAGLFPAEGVYICAIDAETGKDTGAGHWKQLRVNNVSLQGYICLSATRIFLPAGRSSPYVFSRADGRYLGQVGGKNSNSRGTFALIAGERFFTGPAARAGALIEEFSLQPNTDYIAAYSGGNEIVVTDKTSYLLSDTKLKALDRSTRRVIWSQSVSYPYSLILAGDTLFAGGESEVAAFRASDGTKVWSADVEGKVYGLAVAQGMLFVSTDTGAVYAFAAEEPEVLFVRGDVNEDGVVDISDVVATLVFLFAGGPGPACLDRADVDDDGTVRINDPIYLLGWLFGGGPQVPAPFPEPGKDPTPDNLPCGE